MKALISLLAVLLCAGCATYYQQNHLFFQAFENGNMEQAAKILGMSYQRLKRKRQSYNILD